MATATSLKLNTTSSNPTSSNHKDCVLHHHLHHLHNLHQQTNSNTGIDSPTNTNTNIINSNNNGNNNNKPLALSSSLSSCYSSSSSTSSSISSSLASVKIKTLNGKISATNKSAGSDTSNSSPVISHNGTNNFTSSKTFTSYQFSLPAETAQSASARINSKIPFRPINMSVLKQTNDDPSSLMIVNLNEEPAASLLSLSKLERNYSYIEAMKDESLQVSQAESFFLNGKPINAQRTNEPVQPTNPAVITTAGKLLVKSKIKANKNKEKSFDIVNNNNNNNTLDEIMKNGDESHLTNNNTFLRKSHKTKQAQQQNNSHSNYANTNIEESNSQHAIKQSTSPLYSSSSTSTCSSTSSNHAKTTTPSPIPSSTLNNNNKPTEKTTCNIKTTSPQSPSSNNSSAANSNLSKSRSQSSILSLFKNTFSPFSIRKWRSKSRDKLAQQENCASPSQIAANTNNSPSASSASNNTNNKDKIYMKNQQTTNSIKLRVKPTSNTQKCFIENSITSSVQSNTTGFTSTSNNASTNASVTSTNLNHNRVVLDLVNNSNNTSNQDTNRLIINTMPETKPSEQIVFQSVSASATPTTSYRHMISQTSSSQSSPQTERQLSYLKLACFVNGYDSFTSKPKLDTNSANNSFSNELNLSSSSKLTSNNSLNNEIISQDTYVGMKSFDTLNASERFYDLKKRTTNLIKVTSQSPPNISVKSSPTNVQIDIKLETIEDSQILPVKFDDSISATVAVDQVKQDQEKELEKECPQSIHITEPAKSHQLARVIQDGDYYIKLLDQNTLELNALCLKYQVYTDPSSDCLVTNEDALGTIHNSIGKAQLLVTQKFKQFRGLCVKNMNDKLESTILKEGEFVTRDEDLAGFWDMVCLQIEDIHRMFTHLEELKSNNWQMLVSPVISKMIKKPIEKKKPITTAVKEKTDSSSNVKTVSSSKIRADAARQRLIEAKKNAALIKQQQQQQQEQNIEIA